jgi:arsenate reductase
MKTVLFACVHNAGRSKMAAGFFNHLAHPDKAQATSAGTQPAAAINGTVQKVMLEVDVSLAGEPRLLTKELAQTASLLVTMGCGEACPVVPGLARVDWPIKDPAQSPIEEVRQIRDEIRRRVVDLLQHNGWGRT